MRQPPPQASEDLQIKIEAPAAGETGRRVLFDHSGDESLPETLLPAAFLDGWVEASVGEMGRALFAALAGPPVRIGEREEPPPLARLFEDGGGPRVRLWLDPADPPLHALPWELLSPAGPEATARDVPAFLGTRPATPFSRYVKPDNGWPGAPVYDRPIRLLLVVASPEELPDDCVALDPAAELAALRQALANGEGDDGDAGPPLEIEPFPAGRPVTLAALVEALQGGFHILHLVAHGRSHEGETALLLARDDGKAMRVSATDFAQRLAGPPHPALRLLSLACCRTATAQGSFLGFAPEIVRHAGVPAVVAMRGPVEVDAARLWSVCFYRQLAAWGKVDFAANAARAALAAEGHPDFAAPVLYCRLPGAVLFLPRGQIIGTDDSFWDTLLEDLRGAPRPPAADQSGRGDQSFCLPILGPELTRGLLPRPAEMARALAALQPGYPFQDKGDLPRVAQVLATDPGRAGRLLLDEWRRHLAARFPALAQAVQTAHGDLATALAACDWQGEVRRHSELELHDLLASLPFDLYLTTNGDPFLSLALGEARASRQELRWRSFERREWRDSPPGGDEDAPYLAPPPERQPDLVPFPSRERPVVYHLFGTDRDAKSLLVSEDDHLSFLARISYDFVTTVPLAVQRALAERSLLFLGYPPDDLGLKVLLHGLLDHVHHDQFGKQKVAVQIDPEAVKKGKGESIQHYLRRTLNRQADVQIYWGTTRQFIEELTARYRATAGGEARHG